VAGKVTAVSLSQHELRQGFDAFVEAAGKLQQGYAELRRRAEAVDLELKETNRRLEQALAERDAIFAALPLGVVARRANGEASFHNDEARRLCDQADRHGVDLATAQRGDVAFGDGAVRVRRIDLPEGDLVLLEDRSHIQELEREVHRLDKLAGLSELALGVAHEIKNPLNGVMGFAGLLERTEDLGSARRYALRITEGLAQVDHIVKSLLAFARPANRQSALATVAESLSEAAVAAELPATRVALLGDGTLKAESGALQRVLSILLRNAREASSGDVRIEVSCRATARELEITVRDDGPGISADMADRVFTPFVSTKSRGTGLGLPLAVRVLSFLGGELSLLNPGESGAAFLIRLPLVDQAQPADAGQVTAGIQEALS
jgi:signal transduction histidine kinase